MDQDTKNMRQLWWLATITIAIFALLMGLQAKGEGLDRVIHSKYSDKDTVFTGNDGGVEVEAGRFKWANAGIFHLGTSMSIGTTVVPDDSLHIAGPNARIIFEDDSESNHKYILGTGINTDSWGLFDSTGGKQMFVIDKATNLFRLNLPNASSAGFVIESGDTGGDDQLLELRRNNTLGGGHIVLNNGNGDAVMELQNGRSYLTQETMFGHASKDLGSNALQVYSAGIPVAIGSTGSTNFSGIQYYDSTDAIRAYIGLERNDNTPNDIRINASGDINFRTNFNETPAMKLDTDGDLGIGLGSTNATNKLHVDNGTGSNNTGVIGINSTRVADTYNWATESYNSALTTGKKFVDFIGKDKTTNDSGYIGFHYDGDGSTANRMEMGFFNNNELFKFEATGNVQVSGKVTGSSFRTATASQATSSDTNLDYASIVIPAATTYFLTVSANRTGASTQQSFVIDRAAQASTGTCSMTALGTQSTGADLIGAVGCTNNGGDTIVRVPSQNTTGVSTTYAVTISGMY